MSVSAIVPEKFRGNKSATKRKKKKKKKKKKKTKKDDTFLAFWASL